MYENLISEGTKRQKSSYCLITTYKIHFIFTNPFPLCYKGLVHKPSNIQGLNETKYKNSLESNVVFTVLLLQTWRKILPAKVLPYTRQVYILVVFA